MNSVIAVAVGGALGAVSRYSLGLAVVSIMGSRLPWATLGVNLLGSFLIGVVVVAIGDRAVVSELWRPLLVVGFLGAFTTFSSFSLDTLLLLQQGHYNSAFGYIAVSVGACLAATLAGMQLAKAFL